MTLPPDVANVSATVETNAAQCRRRGFAEQRYLRPHRRRAREGSASRVTTSRCPTTTSTTIQSRKSCRRIPTASVTAIPSRGLQREGSRHRQGRSRHRRVHELGRDLDRRRQLRTGRFLGARAAATEKPVDDARINADALAAAAHLHIVAIKSIDLGGGGDGFAPVPMMRMAAATRPRRSSTNRTSTFRSRLA